MHFAELQMILLMNNKNSKSKIDKFIKEYSNIKSKNIIINQFKKIQIKYNIPNKFINDLFYGIKLDTKIVKIKSERRNY